MFCDYHHQNMVYNFIKNNFKDSNFKTRNDVNIHLNQITNEIENINPDIMNLCEIEGKNVLLKILEKNFIGIKLIIQE